MRKIFLFISFLVLFLPPPLKAEESGQAPPQQEFAATIQKIAFKLQTASSQRSFRFKFFNDSLEKTAQAARAMASRENPNQIISLLESARGNYPDNFFAILLEAVLTESLGNLRKANHLFRTFWDKSAVLTDFEKPFMTLEELSTLRKTVYLLLRARGVALKSPQEKAARTQRLFLWAAGLASFLLFLPVVSRLKNLWRERLRPVQRGYQRCPFCHAVFEKLFIECPSCRRKINTPS